MTDETAPETAPDATTAGTAAVVPALDAAAADEPVINAPSEQHPWAEAGRPRGLDAWFAPGGEDDAPPERIADERRMGRLLILMIALLVGVPTLLTLIAFVAQLASLRAGG